MAKTTSRLTDAERDERRARDRDRLQQACEQLLSSEGCQRWVRARGRNGLSRYSVSNLCLIVLANPHASFVAGFKSWLELGYCVRKGERAIRIFAPMPIRERDPDANDPDAKPRVLFRSVAVFDTLSRDRRTRCDACPDNASEQRDAADNEGRGGAGEEPRRGDEPVPPRGRCRGPRLPRSDRPRTGAGRTEPLLPSGESESPVVTGQRDRSVCPFAWKE
jgi:hypothetical protein